MKNSSLAHISFRAILFGTCALVVSSAVQAQVIDWDNTSGNDAWYDRFDNWVGGSPPTSTQTARFNQAATYDVWWDNVTSTQNPEVGFLQILQGDVTFDNRDEEASTQYLYTINGSGGTGAFSDFSISGSGTSLTNRGLHLHSLGGGEVLGGATLTLDGSDPNGAKLTVGGVGFNIGGNLNIQSGGTFDNTAGYIGRYSGSTGIATVTGSGSQWNNSNFLSVGEEGNGTLNVEAGGLVSNTEGYIGLNSSSTGVATVTGSGSQWNNSNGLFLGGTSTTDGGMGSLSIQNQGQVNVGNDLNSSGGTELTISDTGSNGNLWVR
ncbi:hypothetical protein N9X53_08990, partial [Mariniblastus sp.]|nr:hypothetical protein [Mariniblastus sp.]